MKRGNTFGEWFIMGTILAALVLMLLHIGVDDSETNDELYNNIKILFFKSVSGSYL